MDYNANINWIVVGQPDGRKVNVINSFYVKFERHGWTVEAVYIGNPMRHDEKYLLINQGFVGKQRAMPFINRQNFQRPNPRPPVRQRNPQPQRILCKQSAKGDNRKDRTGEKLAESEKDLLEHRTDAFDTLYIGLEKFGV